MEGEGGKSVSISCNGLEGGFVVSVVSVAVWIMGEVVVLSGGEELGGLQLCGV